MGKKRRRDDLTCPLCGCGTDRITETEWRCGQCGARGRWKCGEPVAKETDRARLDATYRRLVDAMAATPDRDRVRELVHCYVKLTRCEDLGWMLDPENPGPGLCAEDYNGWIGRDGWGWLESYLNDAETAMRGDEDHDIADLTDGEIDGIECDGPPDDTYGGSGNRMRERDWGSCHRCGGRYVRIDDPAEDECPDCPRLQCEGCRDTVVQDGLGDECEEYDKYDISDMLEGGPDGYGYRCRDCADASGLSG